jgi:hypothetical protein
MRHLPIVCTLGPEAVKTRRDDLLGGLVRRADERIGVSHGHRLRFTTGDGVLAVIAHVIDSERQCCRFLTFHVIVEPDGGPIWLEVTGPPGTREFLDGMFDLCDGTSWRSRLRRFSKSPGVLRSGSGSGAARLRLLQRSGSSA